MFFWRNHSIRVRGRSAKEDVAKTGAEGNRTNDGPRVQVFRGGRGGSGYLRWDSGDCKGRFAAV